MMSISLQHLPKMDRCFILLFVRCCFSDISLLNYFKVNRSQRLSEAPLKPWLAVKINGTSLRDIATAWPDLERFARTLALCYLQLRLE